MAGKKSLKANIIINGIRVLISMLFPLLTFPYISHVLRADGIGKIYFANSIIGLFVVIAGMGVTTYGVREVAKVRDDQKQLTKTVHELLIINLMLTFVMFLVYLVMVLSIPSMKSEFLLYCIAGGTLLLTPLGIEWLYQASEDYLYITIRSIIVQFISLCLMFIFVHGPNDYTIYIAIFVFANGGSFLFNFFYARKYTSFRFSRVYGYQFIKHIKPMVIIFSISIATTLYESVDTILLGFMRGDVEVGYYTAASKFVLIAVSIACSASLVLLPRMSYYLKQEMHQEFKNTADKVLNLLLFISVPVMILLMFLSKEVIILLSGNSFMPAVIPSIILAPEIVVLVISNLVAVQILIPVGRERFVFYSCITGAFINITMNYFLIPVLGATGVAISNVITQIIVTILLIFFARDLISSFAFKISKMKYFLVGGLTIPLILLIKMSLDNIIWTILMTGLAVGTVYLLIMYFMRDSVMIDIMDMVKQLHRTRKISLKMVSKNKGYEGN